MATITGPATVSDDSLPHVPDRYEILEVLGQGAMGIVYRARDRELDRIVALKTIHPDRSSRGHEFAAIAARLYQEATAAARLSHPGIVTIYDVGRADGVPYVVMEYFKARTLADLLGAGALPPTRAVQILLQVCRALQYAHARGVVHRDIKSSNIFVDASAHAKLGDFGVAHIVDKPTADAGMMIGTPAYMSPEQVRGGDVDGRSDVFSLGVVLYEALTGEKPFAGDDVAVVLDKVAHLDPVPARERNFAVPPALDAIVRRAMSKEPDDRYPDAGAFAEALSQALALADRRPILPFVPARLRTPAAVLVAGGLVTAVVSVFGLATLLDDASSRGAPGSPPPTAQPATAQPAAAQPAAAPPSAAPSSSPPTAPDSPSPASDPSVVRPVTSARADTPVPAASSVIAVTPVPAESAPKPSPVQRRPAPAVPALGTVHADPPATVASIPPSGPAASPAKSACLSVNAVPFAAVYVDGERVADTPAACVPVAPGRRRVVFEWSHERSPEHVIVVEPRHTIDNPLRASYDFRAHRFVTRDD